MTVTIGGPVETGEAPVRGRRRRLRPWIAAVIALVIAAAVAIPISVSQSGSPRAAATPTYTLQQVVPVYINCAAGTLIANWAPDQLALDGRDQKCTSEDGGTVYLTYFGSSGLEQEWVDLELQHGAVPMDIAVGPLWAINTEDTLAMTGALAAGAQPA